MTDEAAKIAAGFSANQRRDILRLSDGEHNPGFSIFLLISDGLATYRRRWLVFGPRVVRLSKKGLAVRAHLERQSDD